MNVSEQDIVWLQQSHPQLHMFDEGKSLVISGPFYFNAAWDEEHRQYIINPEQHRHNAFIHIEDCYEIRIIVHQDDRSAEVYETAGRIKGNAIKWGLPLIDLHLYASGKICYAGIFDAKKLTDFRQLIDGAILQFFYDQSYFERYGRWPRGEYSHGLLGAIENMLEAMSDAATEPIATVLKLIFESDSDEAKSLKTLIANKSCPSGHRLCLCGSGKKIRDCHRTLHKGLWQLNRYYNKNNNKKKEV